MYFFVVTKGYHFHLDGSGDYPFLRTHNVHLRYFLAFFWFKTAEQNTSYLLHYTPDEPDITTRLTVWRDGNTFFVELWKDHV